MWRAQLLTRLHQLLLKSIEDMSSSIPQINFMNTDFFSMEFFFQKYSRC